MNAIEYKAYRERVERYLNGCEAVSTGRCPGCEECDIPCGCGHGFTCHAEKDGPCEECKCTHYEATEYGEEPWFSWSSCEVCNSGLGGDRESWHCVIDGKIVHGSCCSDCVYFIEYGRLDDMTMMDVEKDLRQRWEWLTEVCVECLKNKQYIDAGIWTAVDAVKGTYDFLPARILCDWLEEAGWVPELVEKGRELFTED